MSRTLPPIVDRTGVNDELAGRCMCPEEETRSGLMMDYVKLVLLAAVTFFAALAASWGRDAAYIVHALLIMFISAGMFIWILRGVGEPKRVAAPTG